MKNLRHALNSVIKQEMKAQSGTRNKYSTLPKNLSNYGKITAESSAKGHLDRVNQFCKFMKIKHPKIHNLQDMKKEYIDEYIHYRIDNGISAKTIEADVLTMNHLFIPTQVLKEPLSKVEDYHVVARENAYKNNRQETGKEWINKHKLMYERHKDAIDTLRAFGIRKSELIGTTINNRNVKNGLTDKSFFRNDKGTLSVISVAKGGHLYISDVRNDLSDRMEQLYGKYIDKDHDVHAYMTVKRMIRGKSSTNPIDQQFTKDMKKRLYSGKKLFNKNDVSNNMRAHIFRSEYAIKKLEETKLNNDNSKEISINGYKGTMNQFKEVSENLGHHRIKVLYKYLR